MGVKGLWRLLLPIGRRISIETLEGKVLAVDASIWLAQFLSALKDPETGRTAPSAHLVGFFRRLCRLRYHGIRPVFVFDGVPPEAKRRELARRRRRRDDGFGRRGDPAPRQEAARREPWQGEEAAARKAAAAGSKEAVRETRGDSGVL
jgi:DNA excision repair protein ERCC-5